MKRKVLISFIGVVLVIILCGMLVRRASSSKKERTELASSFLELHDSINPTSVVILAGDDLRLPPHLRLMNPEQVVVTTNAVIAIWPSTGRSQDLYLSQSATNTNIWTFYRRNFIGYRQLTTITNN